MVFSDFSWIVKEVMLFQLWCLNLLIAERMEALQRILGDETRDLFLRVNDIYSPKTFKARGIVPLAFVRKAKNWAPFKANCTFLDGISCKLGVGTWNGGVKILRFEWEVVFNDSTISRWKMTYVPLIVSTAPFAGTSSRFFPIDWFTVLQIAVWRVFWRRDAMRWSIWNYEKYEA